MTQLQVTIPVYNEERELATSVRRVVEFLQTRLPVAAEVLIANNASTDGTLAIARHLAEEFPNVRVLHLELKGRGRALKQAWLAAEAEILAYMDVDLSTDLDCLPALIAPLLHGEADLATGSRLAPGARTTRGFKREFISRSYNRLVKLVCHTRFSDAQCGFKAITRTAAQALLPWVEDPGWFFDTELLILAEKLGYRLHDLPVRWTDDPDSRVNILRTALADLRGLLRVRRALAAGTLPQAARIPHRPLNPGLGGNPTAAKVTDS